MEDKSGSSAYENLWRGMILVCRFASGMGSVILCMMMLLIVADVLLRFSFNLPVQGSFELVELMMACIVCLGIAHTGVGKGHVAVGFLISKLPERIRMGINVFSYLVATVLFALISWKSMEQMRILKESETTTALLELPIYPFMMVLGFCAGLLCLVFLLHTLDFIIKGIRE